VWRKICADIDGVVKTVKPQKLLYLALDGSTPRAKMYD
jgi:5'-3' exonuclease